MDYSNPISSTDMIDSLTSGIKSLLISNYNQMIPSNILRTISIAPMLVNFPFSEVSILNSKFYFIGCY